MFTYFAGYLFLIFAAELIFLPLPHGHGSYGPILPNITANDNGISPLYISSISLKR